MYSLTRLLRSGILKEAVVAAQAIAAAGTAVVAEAMEAEVTAGRMLWCWQAALYTLIVLRPAHAAARLRSARPVFRAVFWLGCF